MIRLLRERYCYGEFCERAPKPELSGEPEGGAGGEGGKPPGMNVVDDKCGWGG